MLEVRTIRPEEIVPMVMAGKMLHKRSAFRHMDYDVDRVVRIAMTALTQPNKYFLKVIAYNDTPVGVLFCYLSESFFGKDLVASDFVFFIVPQMQGKCSLAVKEIVDEYQFWAAANGAKRINLGCSTEIDSERTAKLFEHLGLPQTGTLHSVEVH